MLHFSITKIKLLDKEMGNTILLLGKSMVEKVNARQEKITFKLFGGYFFNWGRRFLIGDGENFKNLK